MSEKNLINSTRHEKYVTVRIHNCHFDLSKELLQDAGMEIKEFTTEIEVKGINCAPVCVMDIDKMILHQTDQCNPEIVPRLEAIHQICNYLGITRLPWSRNITIKEWIKLYPFLTLKE